MTTYKVIQSKVKFNVSGTHNPKTIILHHTAGGRVGSEGYLKQKGLGYHAMIEKDGTIYRYNDINEVVSHASRANVGYVGISFIAGGPLGPVTDAQIQAAIQLINEMKDEADSLVKVSDHATIDVLVAKRGWKSDPQYQGEKVEQNDYSIKYKILDRISFETKLDTIKIPGK